MESVSSGNRAGLCNSEGWNQTGAGVVAGMFDDALDDELPLPDLSFSDGPSVEEMSVGEFPPLTPVSSLRGPQARKRKAKMTKGQSSQKRSNTNTFCGFQEDHEQAVPDQLNSVGQSKSTSGSEQTAPVRPIQNKVISTPSPQTHSQNSEKLPSSLKTMLIEPAGAAEEVRNFFANDIRLARDIDQSPIGQHKISSVNKNRARGLLIITLQEINDEQFSNLLSVTSIGNRAVRCRQPQMQSLTYGVIGPVGMETMADEIFEELKKHHSNVLSVRRIMKDKNQVPTQCMQLTFSGKLLPEHVCIGYQRFPVRLFIDRAWQCYNCLDFGHNAVHCTGKTKCVICSGAHRSQDCPNRNTGSPKCANCNGNHTASYGGCPKMKEAKSVEKVRAEQKLSYRDALRVVRGSQRELHKPQPVLETMPRAPYPMNNSIALNLSPRNGAEAQLSQPPRASVGTQTDFIEATCQTVAQ